MDEARRDLDFFATKEKELGEMPKSGLKKVGDKIVSKHDKELSQRENAKRIMEFPPGIHTGDGGSFDMQVQTSWNNFNIDKLDSYLCQAQINSKCQEKRVKF